MTPHPTSCAAMTIDGRDVPNVEVLRQAVIDAARSVINAKGLYQAAAEVPPLRRALTALDAVEPGKDDRSWWVSVYRMGIEADLKKQPRVPPAKLTIDQQFVWLEGYDR